MCENLKRKNVDQRTGKMIVVSLIDNLVKGQAGSAVQNMNILLGLEETAGLLNPGQYPYRFPGKWARPVPA